jgi:hypothetical protein
MKRRIVLVTCLLGIVGGSAGAAFAAQPPAKVKNHDICIAFAQNENYNAAKYLCIDTP